MFQLSPFIFNLLILVLQLDITFGGFFTIVYKFPNTQTRHFLWNSLKSLAIGFNAPWLVIGNFNTYLYELRKIIGINLNWKSMSQFLEWMDQRNIVDKGFKGPKFTQKSE